MADQAGEDSAPAPVSVPVVPTEPEEPEQQEQQQEQQQPDDGRGEDPPPKEEQPEQTAESGDKQVSTSNRFVASVVIHSIL